MYVMMHVFLFRLELDLHYDALFIWRGIDLHQF